MRWCAPTQRAARRQPVHARAQLQWGNDYLAGRIPITSTLRDQNRASIRWHPINITGPWGSIPGAAIPLSSGPYVVSGNYFDALGIKPYLGRFIHASDEHGKNSVPSIVLSMPTGRVIQTVTLRRGPHRSDQQASVYRCGGCSVRFPWLRTLLRHRTCGRRWWISRKLADTTRWRSAATTSPG